MIHETNEPNLKLTDEQTKQIEVAINKLNMLQVETIAQQKLLTQTKAENIRALEEKKYLEVEKEKLEIEITDIKKNISTRTDILDGINAEISTLEKESVEIKMSQNNREMILKEMEDSASIRENLLEKDLQTFLNNKMELVEEKDNFNKKVAKLKEAIKNL